MKTGCQLLSEKITRGVRLFFWVFFFLILSASFSLSLFHFLTPSLSSSHPPPTSQFVRARGEGRTGRRWRWLRHSCTQRCPASPGAGAPLPSWSLSWPKDSRLILREYRAQLPWLWGIHSTYEGFAIKSPCRQPGFLD